MKGVGKVCGAQKSSCGHNFLIINSRKNKRICVVSFNSKSAEEALRFAL